MSKSTITKVDKPRLQAAKWASVDMLRDHIEHGGGFVSRGKALRYLHYEQYVPRSGPDRSSCGPHECRVRSVWIINDDGSRSTNFAAILEHAENVAANIAIADDDRGGNAWRFSFVDLEYS